MSQLTPEEVFKAQVFRAVFEMHIGEIAQKECVELSEEDMDRVYQDAILRNDWLWEKIDGSIEESIDDLFHDCPTCDTLTREPYCSDGCREAAESNDSEAE